MIGSDDMNRPKQHAVRLMGPRSPFWQCSYCQALSQTPLGFKHKPECIMAVVHDDREASK